MAVADSMLRSMIIKLLISRDIMNEDDIVGRFDALELQQRVQSILAEMVDDGTLAYSDIVDGLRAYRLR